MTGDHQISVTVATCKLGSVDTEITGETPPVLVALVTTAVDSEDDERLSLDVGVAVDGGITVNVLVRGKRTVYWVEKIRGVPSEVGSGSCACTNTTERHTASREIASDNRILLFATELGVSFCCLSRCSDTRYGAYLPMTGVFAVLSTSSHRPATLYKSVYYRFSCGVDWLSELE